MIKIIFSDMDGTLLDGEGNLPAGFDALERELSARDVLFAPSSGRQYYSLVKTFDKYKDRFLFVAENGTAVWYKGKHIFKNTIDDDLVREILRMSVGLPHCYSVFCGVMSGYVLEAQDDESFLTDLHVYYDKVGSTPSFDVLRGKDSAVKLSFYDDEGRAAERLLPIFDQYRDRLQVALASPHWVDLTNVGANKGTAVKAMQEKFGVTAEECAAFGDYMNDAEMMQSVYYSYAMANALPEVKELARFEAPSNKDHGVLRTIRGFMEEGLI